jgi:hypothetical protein
MEQISWRRLPHNKYRTHPDILMLRDIGFEVPKKITPHYNGHNLKPDKVSYLVKFDRDYVVSKIQSEFFDPLRGLDFDTQLLPILREAYQRSELGVKPGEQAKNESDTHDEDEHGD